jgi:glycosyltransferase involved in cell wall biosynthesis
MSDKKIKVIFGVNDFLVGGMQRQFIEQLRFFDRDRFDISLITLFEFPGQPDLFSQLPSDLRIHRLRFKDIRDLKSWGQLYRLLKQEKPDIVLSSLFFANTIFRVLKPLIGYQVIPCEHNTYTDKTFLQRLTDRVLAVVSYRIVAVSSTVASFTAKQEGIQRNKFVVIPNGVDVHAWQEEFAELPSKDTLKVELGFKSDEALILTVGRLMPQKNQKLLLEGFSEFHRTHPKSALAIVGYGPLQETLESYAEALRIKDVVRFFGVRNDVARFYKASDVFVLTSDIEGFPLVCIEAMSAGLPIVSTVTSGIDECIEDNVNGFLIKERTASCVAENIHKAADFDSDLPQEGARKTAESYRTDVSVNLYEQLFEAVISHS